MFRSARLFRLFLAEQSDPDSFYSALALDAVSQVEAHGPLSGAAVLDIGGGPGYLAAAVRARGGNCALLLLVPGLREVVTWNLLLILRRAR